MSPRRSSRARTTQSMSSVPQHTSSSTSSVSSTRADRSVHQHQKLPSPRSSVAARAHSSEDPEGPAGPQSRRNRSSHDNAKDEILATADDEIEDDIEEEVTRCICGNQEYPGLPISPGNTPTGNSTGDTDPVDSTGWFIQCDICKVWQHGGCVGIMDEATSPEEYFCEQCRKDLHRSTTTTNG